MLKRFLHWFYSKRVMFNDSDVVTPKKAEMSQENIRDMETKKRVAAAFKEQEERIKMMAKIPHACADPTDCTKEKCFEWKPDNIISSKVMSKNDIDKDFGR